MTRWGMVIDLRNCFGCKSCAVTCSEANGLPSGAWRQVHVAEIESAPGRQRLTLPASCNQCGDPPCLSVCPTGATLRGPDGVVEVDPERCLGCGYCIVACPYRARTINDPDSDPEKEHRAVPADGGGPSEPGICTKCEFCRQRVSKGLQEGLVPGKDAGATPHCVLTCSAEALHFGDLDDPESPVSRLIRENEVHRLQETLGTDGAVYYIAPEGGEE